MEYSLFAAGMTIHYFDTDPLDAAGRQVLLFLHGWGACKETFNPVIASLRERYRLIAPDLPGCGKTGEPPRPWTVADYADFFQAFVEALGLDRQGFSACGHSHGGRLLIKWAARQPAALKRLILIDSAGLKPKRGPGWYLKVYSYKAGKTLLRLPALHRLLAPLLAGKIAKAGSADYQQASPLMKRTMVLQLDEDLRPCLSRIKAPTLLFWGGEDGDTPLEQGRLMEKEIPDAGLVVLSPAGHYSYLDQLPRFLGALTYFMEH
jgi:pimeloyl-ACP methyl ester carboxylesterase